MCCAKKNEINTSIDLVTNIVNIGLVIAGIFLITLGLVYLMANLYDYIVQLGIILIAAGCIAILVGGWGTFSHARIVKKMKAQAKANVNY